MNQLALDLQPSKPSYRLIPLSQGQFAKVDDSDYEWLSQWKWCAVHNYKKFYAVRHTKKSEGRRMVHMHRLIMGYPLGKEVDHHDGDGLNNQRLNLRIATRIQNAQNQPRQISNTSGFKGVSLHRGSGKWFAQIRDKGKQTFLGAFETAEEAGKAYSEAADRFHGEFARY